jgi:hypothetical protein
MALGICAGGGVSLAWVDEGILGSRPGSVAASGGLGVVAGRAGPGAG